MQAEKQEDEKVINKFPTYRRSTLDLFPDACMHNKQTKVSDMNNQFRKNSMNKITNHQTRIPASIGVIAILSSVYTWVFSITSYIS